MLGSYYKPWLTLASAALAVLLSSAPLIGRSDTVKVGHKGTLHFSAPTRIGTRTFDPGDYKVYCEHKDSGEHQLVVIRLIERNPYFGGGGTPDDKSDIAKLPCRMEPLSGKARATALYTNKDSSGVTYVEKVLIRGETVSHVFEK
ncbi:MAG: hypothetical protein ACE5JX_04105 [Acidobacteriota bacterium]